MVPTVEATTSARGSITSGCDHLSTNEGRAEGRDEGERSKA